MCRSYGAQHLLIDGCYNITLPEELTNPQMTRTEIHATILNFIDVFEGNYAAEDREEKLVLALDQLALAYHFAVYKFDETDYPVAPEQDYDILRTLLS